MQIAAAILLLFLLGIAVYALMRITIILEEILKRIEVTNVFLQRLDEKPYRD